MLKLFSALLAVFFRPVNHRSKQHNSLTTINSPCDAHLVDVSNFHGRRGKQLVIYSTIFSSCWHGSIWSLTYFSTLCLLLMILLVFLVAVSIFLIWHILRCCLRWRKNKSISRIKRKGKTIDNLMEITNWLSQNGCVRKKIKIQCRSIIDQISSEISRHTRKSRKKRKIFYERTRRASNISIECSFLFLWWDFGSWFWSDFHRWNTYLDPETARFTTKFIN